MSNMKIANRNQLLQQVSCCCYPLLSSSREATGQVWLAPAIPCQSAQFLGRNALLAVTSTSMYMQYISRQVQMPLRHAQCTLRDITKTHRQRGSVTRHLICDWKQNQGQSILLLHVSSHKIQYTHSRFTVISTSLVCNLILH